MAGVGRDDGEGQVDRLAGGVGLDIASNFVSRTMRLTNLDLTHSLLSAYFMPLHFQRWHSSGL